MRWVCSILLAGAAQAAGLSVSLADDGGRLPAIVVLEGEMAMPSRDHLPAVPNFVPHLPRSAKPPRSLDAAALRARIHAPKTGEAAVKSARAEDDEEDEDDEGDAPRAMTAPGKLPTAFVRYPNPVPQLKNRSMGPHLRPDVEFDLTERSSFGIIAQLDGLRPGVVGSTLARIPAFGSIAKSISGTSPGTSGTSSATGRSPTRGHDLGLGASFEIKLGQ